LNAPPRQVGAQPLVQACHPAREIEIHEAVAVQHETPLRLPATCPQILRSSDACMLRKHLLTIFAYQLIKIAQMVRFADILT
jgi:hypothetical protein